MASTTSWVSAGRPDAGSDARAMTEVRVHASAPERWELDVDGSMERLMKVLSALPVADLSVEPFSLERHVLDLYQAPAAPARPV